MQTFSRGIFSGVGGIGGGGYMGGISHGGREFSIKGAPNFPALFKSDQKLKKKKIQYLALYAKVCFSTFKRAIYSN